MSDNRTCKIRILQHNCNRNIYAMHSCLETAEKSADIVIIQEPWVGGGEGSQNFHYISYPSFHQLISTTTNRPRTLTYLSSTNPYLKAFLQPNIFNDEDIQVIQISTPNIEPIFLFNIYNESPPHDRPHQQKKIAIVCLRSPRSTPGAPETNYRNFFLLMYRKAVEDYFLTTSIGVNRDIFFPLYKAGSTPCLHPPQCDEGI